MLWEDAGSDVGSLFPFIVSQAVRTGFPLSFLDEQFQDLAAWKAKARGRLLELLHCSPPACEPAPELIESVERPDHVREKIVFQTTPDIRTPAYVLVPKQGRRPLQAIVALHDHGGFYLWGKEKLVSVEPEHRVLAGFKRRYYAGNSIAEVLVAQGYLDRHRHVLLGRAADAAR